LSAFVCKNAEKLKIAKQDKLCFFYFELRNPILFAILLYRDIAEFLGTDYVMVKQAGAQNHYLKEERK